MTRIARGVPLEFLKAAIGELRGLERLTREDETGHCYVILAPLQPSGALNVQCPRFLILGVSFEE